MLRGADFFVNPDLFLIFLQSMVDELCCGPCLAMEIRAPDAPVTFREFVGPSDPVSCLHHNSIVSQYMFARRLSCVHYVRVCVCITCVFICALCACLCERYVRVCVCLMYVCAWWVNSVPSHQNSTSSDCHKLKPTSPH